MAHKGRIFAIIYGIVAIVSCLSILNYMLENLDHDFVTIMEKNTLKYQNRVLKVNDVLELEGTKANFLLNMDDLENDFEESIHYDKLKYLAYDESRDIFHLDNIQNGNFDTKLISNITGKGNLDFLNDNESLKAKELFLLFYLNSDFKWMNERFDSSYWVYYTSLNGMTSMRKRSGEFVTSDEFYYVDEMLELPFVTGGTKENLPERDEVYWSPPYIDLAGKGMMITASFAVDYKDEYIGSISIDFLSRALSGILDERYKSFLVDPDGIIISTNIEGMELANELKTVDDLPLDLSFSDIKDIELDELVKIKGDRVIAREIYGSPYVLYQVYTKRDYFIDGAVDFFPIILIFIFFAVTTVMLHRVRVSEAKLKEAFAVLESKQEELDYISKYDTLTNIYNRRGLYSELKNIETDEKLIGSSLIIFDIDHFKLVNDTYGHDVGDEVLTELCVVVKNYIGESEIFARYGGEEFVIISNGGSLEKTCELAETIRVGVESHYFKTIESLTVSLGVSNFREKDTNDTWIKNADAGLYKAKSDGRNRVCYYDNYELIDYTSKNVL